MLIKDRKAGLAIGGALLVAGWVFIHDATKHRNSKVPLIMRPFYPWG